MGVHSVLMRLFSIYSIFLVIYIPTVIKKRWGSGQWLHPCDREALGFYVFGSAREIVKIYGFGFHCGFQLFFRLKVLGIHE